jgi:hypothetical protein
MSIFYYRISFLPESLPLSALPTGRQVWRGADIE